MKILVFPNRSPNNSYFAAFNDSLRSSGMQTVRLATVLSFRSQFDVMHFHFPDHVITQGNFLKSTMITSCVLCLILYSKFTRRPVVWMVHDVSPLWIKRKHVLSLFMKIFKACVDGHIFLSKSSQAEFYDKNPGEKLKPSALVHITRYQRYKFNPTRVSELKEQYGIKTGEIVIGILGDIKQRKGFQCISLIPNETESGIKVNLAICGRVDGMKEDLVQALLQARPSSHYIRLNKRLEDDELALWIQSSDAVLLPYLIGSNSSMAINVFSNQGRVIASDVPMFQELKDRFGDSWIKTVDISDKDRLEEVINEIPCWRTQPLDVDRVETMLEQGDPDQVGQRLFRFYNELRMSVKTK